MCLLCDCSCAKIVALTNPPVTTTATVKNTCVQTHTLLAGKTGVGLGLGNQNYGGGGTARVWVGMEGHQGCHGTEGQWQRGRGSGGTAIGARRKWLRPLANAQRRAAMTITWEQLPCHRVPQSGAAKYLESIYRPCVIAHDHHHATVVAERVLGDPIVRVPIARIWV